MQYINIAILISCGVVCLILLLGVATSEHKKEKLNRIFLSIVCCHIPLLFVDTIITFLTGRNEPFDNIIYRVLCFLSFVIGTILLLLFIRYLLVLVKIKAKVSRKILIAAYMAYTACGFNILFIILTQFNGMYYSIGENSIFYHGDWYWVSQALTAFCIVINAGILIAQRKQFTLRERIFLSSYVVLPIIAVIIQNINKDTIAVSVDVATTLTILIFYVGIQSEQSKLMKQQELELTESRIAVMLSQIQPHFLYNSLGAIQRLCTKDPKLAEETVIEFTKYLRGNMESLSTGKPIMFEKELQHVENYLALEKKRFGNRLHVVYEIQARNFTIPVLTLQPLVENAVRHGVTKREEGGTVTIRTEETETHIVVIVTDDGVGFDPSSPKQDGRQHIGIENVQSRLAAMCGGTLTIQSKPGAGTTAILTMPKGDA